MNFPIVGTIKEANNILINNFKFLAVLATILIAPGFIGEMLFNDTILLIINLLIGPILSAIAICVTYKLACNQTVAWNKSLTNELTSIVTNRYLQLLILYIALSFMILGGFILLFIPGLIFMVRLSLAYYYCVLENQDFQTSIKSSWNITRELFFNLLGMYLVLLLPIFLSSFIFVAFTDAAGAGTNALSSMLSIALFHIIQAYITILFMQTVSLIFKKLTQSSVEPDITVETVK